MTLFAVTDPITPHAGTLQLVAAALIGIALIVVLISWPKLHPFLSLTIGALTVGALAAMPMADVVASFSAGVGSTVAGVGMLIALGAMFGRLLADSGAADQIVDTIIGRASPRMLPWAMGLVGALIGLPMFFEIGLVLLMPVIMLVSMRSGLSLIRVGIPALAGLSAMHGLVPPHPGPLVAINALNAPLGITLILGVLIAIPTVVIAGPLFAKVASRWVDVAAPQLFVAEREQQLVGAGHGSSHATPTAAIHAGAGINPDSAGTRRPPFATTMATVLLPVVLMMGKAIADIAAPKENQVRVVLDFLGTPLIALLLAVLVALVTFGRGSGMDRRGIAKSLEKSLPPIAGILLIVGAGGGFKQTLIDTGIGTVITDFAASSNISVLFLGWLVAVVIRLATGSATVATITAAGILAPLAAGLPPAETSLLVLAIGAGSVFFSHVNDAGFWLVKEYFRLDIGQNLKTWSVMETLISVVGLVLVLAIGVFV